MSRTVQSSLLALLVLVGVAASTSVAAAAPNVYRTVTPLPVTHSGPVDTVAADVNGDGTLDLVVAEQTQSRVGVFLGNGDGTYQAVVDYWPGGSSPVHPVVHDMNGDGKVDIVVGNALSASVSVMLGNGDGTFQEGANAKVRALGTFNGPQGVVVADFDKNGVPDVAVSTGTDSQKVLVTLGTGDGTLGAPPSISLSGSQPDLAAGDVNGDGNPDLVSVSYSATSRASVLLGNGAGGFASAVTYRTGSTSWAIRLADMDADGKLDIVTANLGGSTVSVLRGLGGGTFDARTETAVGSGPRGLAIGDLDGDGKLDVVESWQSGSTVGVLRGNGDGTLAAEKTISVGDSTYAVALGDLDADGSLDIVAPSYTTERLYVLLAATDAVAPSTTDNVPAGWATTSPFRPTLTATDAGGATVAATYYEVGDPPATPTTSSPVYNAASKPSMTNGQQISYFSVDTAGNAETVKTSAAVKIDAVRPSTTDDVPTAWRKAAVRVTLTGADTGGSGVDKTYYTIGTSPSNPNTSSAVYDPANRPTLSNGQKIRYFTRDLAGNAESPSKTSIAAKVDAAAPTVTDDVPAGWRSAAVVVTLSAADTGGSGVDKTYYEIGASPATPTTASAVYAPANKPTLGDGERISYLTTDVAGNDSGVKTSSAAQVDTAAPTTSDDVPAGWRSAPVAVTLAADDGAGAGVATTYFTVGATPATPTTASSVYDAGAKPVLQDGERISYFSVDAVGNAGTVRTSVTAQVDAVAPTTADDVLSGWQASPVAVTLTASDTGGSGVAAIYYEVGATPASPATASPVYDPANRPLLGDGERIAYFSVDGAGNAEAVRTSAAAMVDDRLPETLLGDVPASPTSDARGRP